MDTRTCPVCGSLLVTVVSSGPEGGLEQVCHECERRLEERKAVNRITGSAAGLLISAGLLLSLLVVTVDLLSLSGRSGFGWRQITGLEVGILCLVVGFLAGRGLLGVAGIFLIVMSVGADLLRLGHAPGLGWRSQTALVVSSLLVAAGVIWRFAPRLRDAGQRERTKDRREH